jgi:hypothetical protein
MEKNLDKNIQKTLEELGINYSELGRRASASDVIYLLDQWPFLQITNTELYVEHEIKPLEILSARSGWKIHNYVSALSSSPGNVVFGPVGKSKKKGEEDKEGGSGTGTLVNQAVITAWEMIELAKKVGWANVKLIDGHPLMVWAAWMKCLEYGMQLEGFTPGAKDYAKLQRIRRSVGQMPSQRPSI